MHELGPCHAIPYRCEPRPWWSWDLGAYNLACLASVALACAVLWAQGTVAFLAPVYLAFALGGASHFKQSLLRGWREHGRGYDDLARDSVALVSLAACAAAVVFALFYL